MWCDFETGDMIFMPDFFCDEVEEFIKDITKNESFKLQEIEHVGNKKHLCG